MAFNFVPVFLLTLVVIFGNKYRYSKEIKAEDMEGVMDFLKSATKTIPEELKGILSMKIFPMKISHETTKEEVAFLGPVSSPQLLLSMKDILKCYNETHSPQCYEVHSHKFPFILLKKQRYNDGPSKVLTVTVTHLLEISNQCQSYKCSLNIGRSITPAQANSLPSCGIAIQQPTVQNVVDIINTTAYSFKESDLKKLEKSLYVQSSVASFVIKNLVPIPICKQKGPTTVHTFPFVEMNPVNRRGTKTCFKGREIRYESSFCAKMNDQTIYYSALYLISSAVVLLLCYVLSTESCTCSLLHLLFIVFHFGLGMFLLVSYSLCVPINAPLSCRKVLTV